MQSLFCSTSIDTSTHRHIAASTDARLLSARAADEPEDKQNSPRSARQDQHDRKRVVIDISGKRHHNEPATDRYQQCSGPSGRDGAMRRGSHGVTQVCHGC